MRVPEMDNVNRFSHSPYEDARGIWQRCLDLDDLPPLGGLNVKQVSVSLNPHSGTLRGLHSMRQPVDEWKVVFCYSGAVQDVIVDLRTTSRTHLKHVSFNLSPGEGVVIPPQCAHGFLTLTQNSHLVYAMTSEFLPSHEYSLAWNDPTLNIKWLEIPQIVSPKDASHPFIAEKD